MLPRSRSQHPSRGYALPCRARHRLNDATATISDRTVQDFSFFNIRRRGEATLEIDSETSQRHSGRRLLLHDQSPPRRPLITHGESGRSGVGRARNVVAPGETSPASLSSPMGQWGRRLCSRSEKRGAASTFQEHLLVR